MSSSVFVITFWQAGAVCLLLPSLFVGLIYAWPGSFRWTEDDRDNPANIRKRLASVCTACLLSFAICLYFADGPFSLAEAAWRALGELGVLVSPSALLASLLFPLLNMLVLYGGPIVAESLRPDAKPFSKYAARWRDIVPGLQLSDWRDVIFGPVAEEFVFRSCMCSLLLAGGWSPAATVWFSPLFFGTAHLHHLMIKPPLQVFVQFCYTTLFGWIVAYYFVQTRCLMAPLQAHVFCNFVSLPEVALVVNAQSTRRYLLVAAYVAGLVGFFLTIQPLTQLAASF